jgi:hypothetical protein
MRLSWLTEKGVLAMNPAREVKTERFSWTEGKTPAFVEGEVQKLLSALDTSTHNGLHDRALLGVLAYTFARIGAVANLKVEDYYPSGKRFLLRFKEKGGKEKELPVHHKLEELLEYLKATDFGAEPSSPCFPAALGKTGKLSRRPLVRTDAADMLKRRLKQAGLPAHYLPHSFRATGITNFLEKMTTLLRPLSASPVTPTAEPRNLMTAAARRFSSKIWSGFGIDLRLPRDGTKPIRETKECRETKFSSVTATRTRWRDDLDTHLKPYLRGGSITSLQIEEHYADTGGATDHVFGLCHLFGFRFAPRIRDLKDRRLYLFPGQKPQPILDPLVGEFRRCAPHYSALE